MEIKKINSKIKCDLLGCKNLATYTVVNEDGTKYNFNLCEQCLKNLHKQFSKILTPKSIKNIYQKGGLDGQAK